MSDTNAAAVNAAWNTTTPYDQIRTSFNPEKGQYDLTVVKLEPGSDKNGLYTITGQFKINAPASAASGPGANVIRTLYVGTHKDKMAELPETRLNSPGLRFLKLIGLANKINTGAQSDAQLCNSLLGKTFGCRVEETEFESNGQKRTGWEFGRNVTPAGTIPARLDREAATTTSTQKANGADVTGAQFA